LRAAGIRARGRAGGDRDHDIAVGAERHAFACRRRGRLNGDAACVPTSSSVIVSSGRLCDIPLNRIRLWLIQLNKMLNTYRLIDTEPVRCSYRRGRVALAPLEVRVDA
jgi:hypothetical protein